MANLRTNNLSGEQGQNAYRGSVFFHGGGQLDVTSNSDFAVGTGAYTAEVWFLSGLNSGENSIFGTFTASNYGFGMWHNANNLYFEERQNSYSGDNPRITYDKFEEGYWYHLAMCRDSSSGTLRAYVNGVQIGSTTSNLRTIAGTAPTIGENNAAANQCNGYISNIRFSNTELYPSGTTFTPPTSELTADASTILLACQNSDDPTQEETGKTLTNSSLLSDQPKVIPPYGVDAGNAFGGSIQQSSQGYMYFPTARTEERGRGRGLVAGGSSPTNNNRIEFFTIQSQGNSAEFGDLAVAGQNAGASSSTRALFGMGGQASPGGKQNVIQFVEIATQGNAVDFGDRTITKNGPGGLSNQTRAVFAGGGAPVPQSDVMDFCTIASIGNATDFGNMTSGNKNPACTASSTRGIIVHGGDPLTNVIDFITIATAGNAQDFGDATVSAEGLVASSSPTRGIIGGGLVSPAQINNIMFITIATTGDATDFGDLTQARQEAGGISNSIRACFASGGVPSAYNTIDFVTIATRGDALDFGDTATSFGYRGGASDSHGGLS